MKIRGKADQKPQHPLSGTTLTDLAAELGVFLIGNLIESVLGGSSIIAGFAAIFGVGSYAAIAYYALVKIGLQPFR